MVNTAASPRAPVVCTRKRRFEEDERQSIPNVLQGEVARLDPKFLVNLDPSHCSNNGTVHLICKLGECRGWGGSRMNRDWQPQALPLPRTTCSSPSPGPSLEPARCPPWSPHAPGPGLALGAGP